MKLQVESVDFKNFLSFGSRVTSVPFLQGVNLVSGEDLDRKKSNGAGKSSFLETVPFALFGQVHRNIKKEQIINWKNRRQCEVIVTFKRGESTYQVLRAIKPDKFEIYKDDTLIDRPSHARDYQKILNEILGINFPAFMSLIHSNINSSAKILSMKKPDKRKFIETMFGLSLYTKLNEKCNSKLRSLKEKIREIDLTNLSNHKIAHTSDQRILELHKQVKKLSIPEAQLLEATMDKKMEQAEYDRMSEELDDVRGKVGGVDLEKKKWEIIRERLVLKCIPFVEQKITVIDMAFDTKNKAERYTEQLKQLEKTQGSLESLRGRYDKNFRNMEKSQAEEVRLLEEKAELHGTVRSLATEISVKWDRLHLLEEDICPTCGTEFNDEELYHQSKNEVEALEADLSRKHKESVGIDKELEKLRSKYFNLKGESRFLRDTMNLITDLISQTSHIESDEKYEEYQKDKDRYLKVREILNGWKGESENKIIRCDTDFNILIETESDLKYWMEKTTSLKQKIKELQKEVETKTELKKELLEMIHTEDMMIRKLNGESRKSEKKKSRLVEVKDYLEFIRVLCKDENIKQHAISSIMPYMNKQTNFYLSEVDYGFYTVLDKWLDAEIKGPGVVNASYGSLSGGEGRGIDIALQFAFLDIARLQAGIFPDYLTFDELLDSSIDGKGISELFKIIKARQKDDESKIFIISHRSELDEIDEVDNVYHVVKENGYSRLEIRS